MRKPLLVGTFYYGFENVRVFFRNGSGGDFFFCPSDKGCAIINIGWEQSSWSEIVEVMVHEAMEFGFARSGHRFDQNPTPTRSHASYVFMFNHEEMELVASAMGSFLSQCLPEMAKSWNLLTKKRKLCK